MPHLGCSALHYVLGYTIEASVSLIFMQGVACLHCLCDEKGAFIVSATPYLFSMMLYTKHRTSMPAMRSIDRRLAWISS